jgi:hypothetical protein
MKSKEGMVSGMKHLAEVAILVVRSLLRTSKVHHSSSKMRILLSLL